MVNAACCLLVSDDQGGVECTVAWMGGSDKDIPVHSQYFFFPLPTFLQGQITLRIWMCVRRVCVRVIHSSYDSYEHFSIQIFISDKF